MHNLLLRLFLQFIILSVFSINVFSQDIKINISWSEPVIIYSDSNQVIKSFWFENANPGSNIIIPEYKQKIGVTDPYIKLQPVSANETYVSLTQNELIIYEQSGFQADTNIVFNIKHSVIRKEQHTYLSFYPFRKNPVTGKIEKLISADIYLEVSFLDENHFQYRIKTEKTTQSVLSSGTFYKISVSQPGIYRLTSQNLTEMGIDVSTLNPKNIRIYGNGGQMLPEDNSTSRVDDLFENAVYVHGEDDNSFDAGDYVLFYAPGPHSWSWDSITREYTYTVNKYNDKSYYFLTIDKGAGKRIVSQNHMSETPSVTISTFLDRAVHENETYNLIKSGKEWYGEEFDISLSQSFSFGFSSIVADSCMKVRVHMVARASAATSATVSVGSNQTTIGFSGTTGYTSDYAKTATAYICANPSASFNVNISYNKNNLNDAKAWLNKITVNAWRQLSLSGNQMHFRNPYINDPGNFCRFNLTSTFQPIVWDITNPLEPFHIQGEFAGSTYSFLNHAYEGKEYIAHNGLSYLTPSFEGTVSNQNLHGLPQVDYIIVSHSLFVDEAISLGQFHNDLNNLSFVVVTPQKIYNEFSSGSQDPSAIRDFVKMFYDRATSDADMPKYLLLFGRASYDYKNRISDNTNFVPTFQSIESLRPTDSYASDDFFGLLDDGEGNNCDGHLDIGIGRIPAKTEEEAQQMTAKIFRYHEKTNSTGFQNTCDFIQNIPNLSDWRNWITFLSDDGNGNLHFNQSEGISFNLGNSYKHLNIDKIHLDSYPQLSTPGGERAPSVNEAINRRMYLGCLIMNYTGHGGEVGWAHERILELSDINGWENYYNMPLFITATCEFSRFDDPQRIAAGEMVLTNPNGGGIALFSTTRLAYSSYNENINRSIYKVAFEKTNSVYPTLGEILSFAKTDNGSNQFIRNFILLGDPAMRLAYPQHQVVTTKINGNDVNIYTDTVSAYSFVTVEGYIADELGNKLTGFNGVITPTVFDKPSQLSTLGADSESYPSTFYLQKNIIYKGKASVVNGDFSFSFYVPRDINYSVGQGKISYYAENGETDATGYYNGFYVGGPENNIFSDNTGPEIRLYMNDTTFVNGGTTNENPVLIALLYDEAGINTMGSSIGHDIVSILDNSGEIIVMNDYYEAELDSYQKGKVVYPFYNLEEGIHAIYFKVWDVFNNSSEAVLSFYVSLSHEAVIRKLMNYPNPFTDYTDFIFEHNQSCAPYNVKIDIFTVTGQYVCTVESEQESLGYSSEPLRWHGLSSNGAPLASGVYVYTLSVTTCEGVTAQKSSRLVIIK